MNFTTTEDQIQNFIIQKQPVTIKYTTEWVDCSWAVEVNSADEFWLDAFKSLPEAIEFCCMNDLPYTVMGLTKTAPEPAKSQAYIRLDSYIENHCRDDYGMLDMSHMRSAITTMGIGLTDEERLLIYCRLVLKPIKK